MKVLKYIGYTILGIVFLFLSLIYLLKIQRETVKSRLDIQAAKNLVIPIKKTHSQRVYYGGHGLGWGGGDVKNLIEFNYLDKAYSHETPFILVLFRLYKEDFYVVYYDRETDFNNITYRFYKSNKKREFEEIKATTFPKHLAIQNRFWCIECSDGSKPEELIGLEPTNMLGTTTAQLWYLIEGKPKMYNENPKQFLKEYKRKYITSSE
ncbi:hypothetical protein [Cellulophaga baltica]|uniref:Uncharacterized protein n=1 Tax=Cellulophaga baltica TaxID=76594 RepID=A0A1G7LL90_9FLAO|nr:hypothetical protein [Cellulophaga baltica]SDF50146.1 hypothetical protein SAMN04487992_1199 [Cellulophaga baltica]